ncbi:MAG: zinc-dependent alcohol dehydrogenase family protein [Candidatus Eremiobacteraeota bacterium]|nr:zinc-dependent alcohol dehydrogenase family protein [Candidatus Eremiobacteraeota bacterium]
MKAEILTKQQPIENSPLQLADIPKPSLLPDEVLIKVSVCGVCRTDLHVIEGDLPVTHFPLIPGHQIVGKVVESGSSCARFKIGDRIGIPWLRKSCGTCQYCVKGRENLCDFSQYTGYHANGGYAEYATVPEAFAYPIPDMMKDEQAAPLLCAGIIGFRAFKKSSCHSGGKLGIFGFGSSAHIIIQIALRRECEVFVISRGEKHQDLAKEMGASWVSDSADSLPVKLDSAIIFAPAGEIVPIALRSLDKGGTAVMAGIHLTTIPSMSYEEHLFHEKRLVSVESNTREDGIELFKEAVRLHISPKTTIFPLSEANEALLKLKKDEISGTAVLKI